MPEATDSLTDRLRQRMHELGMKPGPVADAAGVGRSFVYDILRGKSANPTSEKLMRVAAVLRTSVEYLTQGVAADGRPEVPPLRAPGFVSIPFARVEAAMGGGAVVEDEEDGDPWHFNRAWLRDKLRLRAAGLRLLTVKGDSMEPSLYSGDVVMIDTAQTSPSPPGIFVLHDGFGLVAKRLEHLPNSDPPRVRILSDNPRYSAYEMTIEEIRVVGRLVWFARQA